MPARAFLLACALVLTPAAAAAQSGFFSGGAADGIASSNRLELQRRALELDAIDGGSRFRHLRREQEMDAIERQIQRNNEFLESLDRAERHRRALRGF